MPISPSFLALQLSRIAVVFSVAGLTFDRGEQCFLGQSRDGCGGEKSKSVLSVSSRTGSLPKSAIRNRGKFTRFSPVNPLRRHSPISNLPHTESLGSIQPPFGPYPAAEERD